jgi:hypothetical protein
MGLAVPGLYIASGFVYTIMSIKATAYGYEAASFV